MNITESEVRQALEAMEHVSAHVSRYDTPGVVNHLAVRLSPAIATLKEALARPSTAITSVQLPKTAGEIRDFIGSNFNSCEFKNAPVGDDLAAYMNCPPSDGDKYSVSAHDLLSSFYDLEEDCLHASLTTVQTDGLLQDEPGKDERIRIAEWLEYGCEHPDKLDMNAVRCAAAELRKAVNNKEPQ